MRNWVWRNATSIVIASTAASIAAHAGLITAWVFGTMPQAGMPPESVANRPYYIPPPDRDPPAQARRETVHYIDLTTEGLGTGAGTRTEGNEKPVTADQTLGHDEKGIDSVTAPAIPPPTKPEDSIYTVLEVDTAVVRSASSAAPAYPPALLAAHIEGYVNAQYVVDTTGRADTTSFTVLNATNDGFVRAVLDVLPRMKFQPAKIGTVKVRQLVRQQFSFRIAPDSAPPAPAPPKKPAA
jgi:protein TonB